jgi:hypothetical protein
MNEFDQFANFLDAQPGPIRAAVQFCLCLLMVEAGKIRLLTTLPGEAGRVCIFSTLTGDLVTVARPPISQEDEAVLIDLLRIILNEESE